MKEETFLRRKSLPDFDQQFRKEYKLLCGVDEAGRGPLAGDVYAAAVILPEGCILEGLDDSKKISEHKREKLYEKIKEKAICWSVATASIEEIEKYNSKYFKYFDST